MLRTTLSKIGPNLLQNIKHASLRRSLIITGASLIASTIYFSRCEFNGDEIGYMDDLDDLSLPIGTNGIIRVGIVGSGIAGSSCAYFLRELLKDDVDIVVYEKNERIGGRTRKIYVDGIEDRIELGGSSIISENKYAKQICEKFNLEFLDRKSENRFGIWDHETQSFIFEQASSRIERWIQTLKLGWRYGLSPLRLRHEIKQHLKKFVEIYKLQDEYFFWKDNKMLFEKLGLYPLTQETLKERFENKKMNENFVRETLIPILRVNYMQELQLSAFAGVVGLAGLVSHFTGIKNGTVSMSEKTIEASNAIIKLNTRVFEIQHKLGLNGSDKYIIKSEVNGTNKMEEEEFDVVVIATPLEFCDIKFTNIEIPNAAKKKREFRKCHVTLVHGNLNPSYFGSEKEIPDEIITLESASSPFNYLLRLGKDKEGLIVYKFYSKQELDENLLNKLFEKRTKIDKYLWNAYPILEPTEEWHPPILAPNLYYINSFESVISTIETSIISSKNISYLIGRSVCRLPYQMKDTEKNLIFYK